MQNFHGAAMRVAILQSCYIPWRGYFDIIGLAEIFVIYDDVQYRKNHWHNRNIVKGANGLSWLTVPVSKASGSFQNIDTVEIAQSFSRKHWKTIEQSYAKSYHFNKYAPYFESLYAQADNMRRISDVNFLFLESISRMLGFDTRFVWSSSLGMSGESSDRVLAICKALGATSYLSGPAAQSYLQVDKFADAGIDVEWMDYSGYPEYPQLHGAFEHQVSIIDLILNTGDQARSFMKSRQR